MKRKRVSTELPQKLHRLLFPVHNRRSEARNMEEFEAG